ncbi:50S ribosomal protein L33 [Patescibacteria group bacterium]
MASRKENLVKLKCVDCNNINYWSSRNKKKIKEKLELNKFCKKCRKHTLHKEMKK